jgi:hypothetical protein
VPGSRISVLYLGGVGRSGSTLIERLIGQLPGVCPVGELVHLWQRGIVEGERCGCGRPFGRCPFWRRVGQAAFGGWDAVDPRRVAALRARVDRNRFIPLVARGRLDAERDEYTSYYARLYAAVAEVSGGRLVVDSSKHPSLAHCLRWRADLDLRVLHLVRDSRAVAYSWSQQVRRPDTDRETYMTRYSPVTAAAQWMAQNAAFHALAGPVMRLRYEDFTAAPTAALGRMAAFAGLPEPAGYPFLGADWAVLDGGHSVSGNPLRFVTGKIPVSRDDRWRAGLPDAQRRAVTALTLPLLAGYGYLGAAP